LPRPAQPRDRRTTALIPSRWPRPPLRRAAAHGGRIGRWKQLNEIRAWVARERGAIVQLAEEPWDPERFAEGQLVLLTSSPAATASAAREFVYRLPRLDVPLRAEDVGETESII